MAKKQKCPEFENHERWLVSYADMLTLLFAVFVVLFALKEGGDTQVKKTAGSMQESFNTPLDDIPLDRQNGPSAQGYGIFEHRRGTQVNPPMIEKFQSNKEQIAIIDKEMEQVGLKLEERLYGPNKHVNKETTGHERIVQVERTRKGFKLQLLARHFYKPGAVDINRAALPKLDKIITILKELGKTVSVEGHTDSIPPKGQRTNWELSALRATSIVRYMIKNHFFPQTRLGATGYADIRPIAHNGTKAGRRLNRRIEFHIEYDDESMVTP